VSEMPGGKLPMMMLVIDGINLEDRICYLLAISL
jgi:hypothetical protein